MIAFRDIYRPVPNRQVDVDLSYLEDWIRSFDIRLDPDYQRDHVWTETQQSAFVGFVLEGGNPPPVYLNNRYENDGFKEVIDGKQRLTALLRWVRNEIPATLSYGSLHVYARDLDHYRSVSIPTREVKLTREETLRFYLLLNGGGTVHSEAELERVRALLNGEKG
jgi:hypothetical protein